MNPPALGVYGLTTYYGKRKILDEISFELESGKILALLGPNGSGKSTLLKAASGLLKKVEGVVRYRGQEILSESARTRARMVAYVPPDIRADFPLTAQEAVLLGRIPQSTALVRQATPEDRSAVQAAMEKCYCWSLRDRDLHTLSGGERQLVTLARALAQGARALLLDEALSRMDLNHQAAMGSRLRALASEGYAIILVAHDLNLACEWADLALLLKDGKKIGLGSVREVLTQQKLRELYPDADLVLAPSPVSGIPKVFFGQGSKA